jgi:hypothetical protein
MSDEARDVYCEDEVAGDLPPVDDPRFDEWWKRADLEEGIYDLCRMAWDARGRLAEAETEELVTLLQRLYDLRLERAMSPWIASRPSMARLPGEQADRLKLGEDVRGALARPRGRAGGEG